MTEVRELPSVSEFQDRLVGRLKQSYVADIVRRSPAGDMLRRRFGSKRAVEPRWDGVHDLASAVDALKGWATEATSTAGAGAWAMTLGDGGSLHRQLNAALLAEGMRYESTSTEELDQWTEARTTGLAILLCAYPDARRITDAAQAATRHPVMANVRFEYASGLYSERDTFDQLDEYHRTWFISPVLLDAPSPYEIYAESLEHFEQKCGLRDFLDLYQLLRQVVVNGVPGDIAEFGSYHGHSGYLIAKSLHALGAGKRLFMFDTFESFPEEPFGVDTFWSNTHPVDFASVQARFAGMDQVSFVKGDFTETLETSGVGRLALAFIDCDSYRATRYLIDAILPARLEPGGLVVCEDYGHPALLGNRVAVRESMGHHPGCFEFFSQFSGLYVIMKPR